jgi:outer membrane receptor protein involved in Fe transport
MESALGKPTVRLRSRTPIAVTGLSLLTSSLVALPARAADKPVDSNALEEMIVTAQKRTETLQSVAASLEVLDTKKLESLQATSFDQYARYLPSLSAQNSGPGHENLYIRGLTNASDGLEVGSQPTVAVYLDEQPVTTIGNNLDVHIYDMARVEELSGPQGTLYGSSAMAGTLRLITNKPSTQGFTAGYDLNSNVMTGGATGWIAEGFVNLPLTEHAAVRLVGFSERDGGYINNVPRPPETYPTSGAVRSNAALARRHFNAVSTSGARAALGIDLDNSWTITPSAMLQHQAADGVPYFQPGLGDLNVARYLPDTNRDRWWQAALTVQGKLSDLDLVYTGSHLNRDVGSATDYSGYSFYYDTYYTRTPDLFGNLFRNDAGTPISPAMRQLNRDQFTKTSHELRVSSPGDARWRFVAGAFLQQQTDDWHVEFKVDGLATNYSITGLPGVVYLNAMQRVDRDRALFGEISHDFSTRLTVTAGLREFAYDNTVYGFFGYNGVFPDKIGGSPRPSGEQFCVPGSAAAAGPGRPCINVDERAAKTGSTHKLTLSYRLDTQRRLYATWSTGFRPGGINRFRDVAPYRPDYLSNFEAGWKTTWLANRLRFNGALFFEQWRDPQFAISGPNFVLEVINAGAAEVRGLEAELKWAASGSLTVSGAAAWLDAHLTEDACRYGNSGALCNNAAGVADASIDPEARSGSRLPTSRFKANLIVHYVFRVGDRPVHLQAASVVQGAVPNTPPDGLDVPGFASLDLSAGIDRKNWSAELYANNALDRRGEQARFHYCGADICAPLLIMPIMPRVFGLTYRQRF